MRDWDKEIDRRFPEGVTPAETPLLKYLRGRKVPFVEKTKKSPRAITPKEKTDV